MPKPKKATVAKSLLDLQPIIRVQQSKLEDEAKDILKTEAKVIFDYFPHIQAIRWQQRRLLITDTPTEIQQSEFCLDQFEYNVSRTGRHNVPTNNVSILHDPGLRDEDWISPWNDSRIDTPELLDQFTQFENKLFDAETELRAAIGQYDLVTVTRKDVSLVNY